MQVEGSVVHIMKALASHPSSAQSLIEDDSLQLLFQVVANGSLIVFARYKEGLVPLHSIQLHRHAMQVNEQCVLLYVQYQLHRKIINTKNILLLFADGDHIIVTFRLFNRYLVYLWSMTMEAQPNIFASIIWYAIITNILDGIYWSEKFCGTQLNLSL